MDKLQKKFIGASLFACIITIGCALLIRSGGNLFLEGAFFHLFACYDLSGAVLSILILIAGMIFTRKIAAPALDGFLDSIERNPVGISALTLLVCTFGALFIYQRHPLCMDEYMPYFQARAFAAGKLWGQFPPPLVPWLLKKHFFAVYSSVTGRVVSNYWPGFALLLTPFMKLGVPWLLNPIISAGTLLLLFYYTKRVLPDATAAPAWALLLTVSSSVFLVDGISFYSMSAHLFMNLLYATLLLELSPLRLFLAGLVGSLALVLHNPVPHMLFAIPWIIWVALQEGRLKNLSLLFAGYAPFSLVAGFGWVWLKMYITHGGNAVAASHGSALAHTIKPHFQAPSASGSIISSLWEKAIRLAGGCFNLPTMGLIWDRLLGLLKLFGWAVPGLPILALLGIRYIGKNRHLQLWGWSAALTFTGYMFVRFSQGHGWGFRYFHSAWLSLPLLATAFLTSTSCNRASWKKLVLSLAVLSLVFSNGLRFYQVHQFIHQDLAQLPKWGAKGTYICILDTTIGYYMDDLVQDDPFLRNRVIILRQVTRSEDNEMMQALFPGAEKVSDAAKGSLWRLPERAGTVLAGLPGRTRLHIGAVPAVSEDKFPHLHE